MPDYGISTGGGVYGGVARGLEAGIGIADRITGQAQEAKFRTAELGLQTRAAERADQEQMLNMHKIGYDLLKDRVAELRKNAIAGSAAYYDEHKDDPNVTPYESTDAGKAQTDSINAMLDQMQEHADRIAAPHIYAGIQQAQKDARDLADKKVDPLQLPDGRLSRVYNLTGHQAVDYVHGHDHDGSGAPDQQSPIGVLIDNANDAAAAGNWNAVQQHMAPVIAPHMSMHGSDHDKYFAGIRGPYAPDAGTPNGHLQQMSDIAGSKGALVAVTNSHPDLQQKLIDEHKAGAGDTFNAVQRFAYRIGGIDQLPSFLQPDDKFREFQAAKKAGYNDQEAFLISHAPGIMQAREEAKIMAPLRQAQTALARAEVQSIQEGGGRYGTFKPFTGTDGKTYTFNPQMREFVDAEGNARDPHTQVVPAGGAGSYDPQSVDSTAQMIANRQMPALSGMALRTPWGQQVMGKVAQLDPKYDASDFQVSQKAAKDFATGKQGNAVRSFNVSLSHLESLGELSDALHNGDIQLVNKIGNYVASQTGNPAPTSFDAAKKIVGDEIVKAIVGGGGGVADREEAAKTISAANSPAQLKSVIDTYKTLMRGQLKGLRQQYEQSTRRTDFDRFLSPSALQEEGGGAPSAGAAGTPTDLPMTDAKGWTLHTDAKGNQAYVSPDGKKFREVGGK